MDDLSPSQISKLKENLAVPKPDTLVVVSCEFGETEVNELGLSLKLTVYFVMGDTAGSNHFMSMKIQLLANIWDGEERFVKLEEQLGEQFFKNYEIQLIFDDNSQSKAELEVFQTLDMPARLQFSLLLEKVLSNRWYTSNTCDLIVVISALVVKRPSVSRCLSAIARMVACGHERV